MTESGARGLCADGFCHTMSQISHFGINSAKARDWRNGLKLCNMRRGMSSGCLAGESESKNWLSNMIIL